MEKLAAGEERPSEEEIVRLVRLSAGVDVDVEFLGQTAAGVSSYPQDVFRHRLTDLGLDVVRERMAEFVPNHMEASPEVDLFLAARKA